MYYLIKLEITSLECEKDFFLTSLDEIDLLIYKEFNAAAITADTDLKRAKPPSESMNSKQRNVQRTSHENSTNQTLTAAASTQQHTEVDSIATPNA